MYYGFGFSREMLYILLIVITLVLGIGASAFVNSRLSKYSRVANSTLMTGAQYAYQMLAYYGITNVQINMGAEGQDFFDPKTNSITLSPSAFNDASVTSAATACHEVGHACQYAFGYSPMKVRGSIVPVVNACSNAWIFILLIGIFMHMIGLVYLALIVYAAVVIFQLVTLPVEFNASNRALVYLRSIGVSEIELSGANSVLRACAFTYVAAALASILQLLYLLISSRD